MPLWSSDEEDTPVKRTKVNKSDNDVSTRDYEKADYGKFSSDDRESSEDESKDISDQRSLDISKIYPDLIDDSRGLLSGLVHLNRYSGHIPEEERRLKQEIKSPNLISMLVMRKKTHWSE